MSDYLSKMSENYDKKKSEAPLDPKPGKRPLGLTFLAIGSAIIGLLLLLRAVFFLGTGALGSGQAGASLFMTGILLLDTPVLLLLFAFGAWKRKGWALYLGLFLMAWEFLFGLLRLLGGGALVPDAVFLVIELIIFVYLLRPSIRNSFDSINPTRAD
jgi:hypothetical protein